MLRLLRTSFLFGSLFFLAGCTTAAIAVIDEKMSQLTEKDCTSVNIVFGDGYCKEKTRPINQEPVYCYRTLGGIDCYAEKDPYAGPSGRVREVSALGSKGAKVEYIGQKTENKSIFNWPFASEKLETAEIE